MAKLFNIPLPLIRKYGFYLFIFFTLSNSSCLTYKYSKSNKRTFHVRKEFKKKVYNSENRLFKGRMNSKITINGSRYIRMQFPGILKGKERYLTITLPHDERNKKVTIGEDDAQIPGEKPEGLAFLFFKTSSSTLSMFTQVAKGQKDYKPQHFLSGYFRYPLKLKKYPITLCQLDLSSLRRYSLRCFTWKLWENKPLVTSYHFNYKTDNYKNLENIRWVARSKGYRALRYMGYVGTVAVDIVTSPVQLIFLYFFFYSGGDID
jgi:hypothetical protein